MIRFLFLTFSLLLLTACDSNSTDTNIDKINVPSADESSNPITDKVASTPETLTLAEYKAEESFSLGMNCDTENSHELPLAIDNLNELSQQIFSLPATSTLNSYANFIALSQLSLTSQEHTAALIEQLGLAQATQNNDWLNHFCQLEQQLSTITTEVSMANDWQVNKSLLTQLNQYFPVTFTETQIDPSSNLWRLSIENNWLTEVQLTVNEQDYVYYQATDSAETKIARAILISGDITTASNEIGEYIRITDDSSNITVNIIMPNFAQYSTVKSNLIDTLNIFKQLEQSKLTQILIPYFASIDSDGFFNFSNWISYNNIEDIFADEGQNFSGINAIESFKLLLSTNTNSFVFDAAGKIKAQSTTELSYQALRYQEEAFQASASLTLTSSFLPL